MTKYFELIHSTGNVGGKCEQKLKRADITRKQIGPVAVTKSFEFVFKGDSTMNNNIVKPALSGAKAVQNRSVLRSSGGT